MEHHSLPIFLPNPLGSLPAFFHFDRDAPRCFRCPFQSNSNSRQSTAIQSAFFPSNRRIPGRDSTYCHSSLPSLLPYSRYLRNSTNRTFHCRLHNPRYSSDSYRLVSYTTSLFHPSPIPHWKENDPHLKPVRQDFRLRSQKSLRLSRH